MVAQKKATIPVAPWFENLAAGLLLLGECWEATGILQVKRADSAADSAPSLEMLYLAPHRNYCAQTL